MLLNIPEITLTPSFNPLILFKADEGGGQETPRLIISLLSQLC